MEQIANFMYIISFIVLIIYIVTYGWLIIHLINLKTNKCICSFGWKHTTVLVLSIILLIKSLITIALLLFNISNIAIIMGSLATLFGIIQITNIVMMLIYSHELKEKDCQCAIVNHTQEVMKIFAIGQIVVILTILVLIPIVFMFTESKSVKKKSKK